MRTFIVAHNDYMGEGAGMTMKEAVDVEDLLNQIGVLYTDEEDGKEKKYATDEEAWKAFDSINGDGQPFYIIRELVVREGIPKLREFSGVVLHVIK